VQDVEEERRQRHGLAQGVDVAAARCAARRLLERPRAAVRAQRDGLAVEDDRAERQRPHGLDDLRHALSDRIERAGEHGDVVAVAVHLDADAVELPLDRGRLDLLQRGLQRRRGLGEHRLHRAPDLQPEAGESCGALRDGGLGDGGQVAREHGRPAHRGGLDLGGGRHGVGDDARERALAQLAAGEHREEALLVGRGAREQLRELLPAHRA